MSREEVNIMITIDFQDEDFAEVIIKALEPENNQTDSQTEIKMSLDKNKLLLQISSSSSLTTIRNTVDDILSTVNTSESIYRTIKRK